MSPAQKPIPTLGQAEELLGALEGVVSAHVVAETGGRIVEIHVLARPDLHPKQVVRNVESALSAGLGITIDRRVVSVAQIRSDESGGTSQTASSAESPAGDDQPVGVGKREEEGGDTASSGVVRLERPAPRSVEKAPAPVEANRLEYVRYESRRDAELCTCEVVVRDGGEEIRGRGTGPDTMVGRAEAAARALIDAVVRARPEIRLALEGAVLSSSRGKHYVIVAAHVVQDRATTPLCGAAPVTRSPEEAGILAALQATNRWSD